MINASFIFVAVGSNIEPEENIPAALTVLMKSTRVLASSTFYRTEAVGPLHQPDFVNGVWQIDTALAASEVKKRLLLPIERKLGRERTNDQFAPRTIDLDLVLYDDRVIDDGCMRLPHPDLKRTFVCMPVMELLTASVDIDPVMAGRVMALLPPVTPEAMPGDVLVEFSLLLRTMLASRTGLDIGNNNARKSQGGRADTRTSSGRTGLDQIVSDVSDGIAE